MCHYLLSRFWEALCKPELMADRFLNTKSVVVVVEIQSQHMKNNVQFISIPKGNKAILPESQASRNSMDFEILTEAEANTLHWRRYSSYIVLLTLLLHQQQQKNTLWSSSCLQSKSERNIEEKTWPIWGKKKCNLIKENDSTDSKETKHIVNLSEMQWHKSRK